ncbi:SRPBCC domain-containing protein [Leucobacter luti]|uniref:SRPBCC domain-containing protein n=1 Tax=Leucobacter luti TaxID=340320 RepID=UPI003D041769
MTIEATGRVVATAAGRDLIVPRSLAMPIAEAWIFVSDSEHTEQWFGPWEGDGRTGGSIRVRMRFEEGHPEIRMNVLACEAPARLALKSVGEYGSWDLELRLEEDGEEDTLVSLVHHLGEDDAVGEIGPGWEFYMDLLVAATEGTEEPTFDQYYPSMSGHYTAQLG